MSKSNNNGRALEYIIVQEIINTYNGNLIDSCKYMQTKDEIYFTNLDNNLKNKFTKSSKIISNWLNEKYKIQDCLIERIDDNQAKSDKSDVTDIRINNDINLSIKHNHNALKHQRPGALPQQCGFEKKSKFDIEYREKYQEITKQFLHNSLQLLPGAKLFSELKAIDENFINNNFYYPVCNLVSDFINDKCNDEQNVKFLFNFIVGNINFIKIVVSNSVLLYNFSEIPLPTKVTSKVENSSYVILTFDNGWEISMRLHTASSRLETLSLKFDSQSMSDIIKPIELV